MKRIVLVALCVSVLAGCARYPANAPIDAIDPDAGYRVVNTAGDTDDSTDLVLILTFSGGGTRAAALSYGVLEALRDTVLEFDGRKRRLLDEIDIISSVSGGSVTAAYYGLHGEKIFDDFEPRFLRRNAQGALTRRFLAPWNWPSLLSPFYGRGDATAEYFNDILFEDATFADLLRPGAPAILINATDISQGTRFLFSQDTFDLLCSDISSFPIARAVAASSAVPVLLSPITLINYPKQRCGFEAGEWVDEVLDDVASGDRRAQEARRIRHYTGNNDDHYVHLVDGGLADNLGLRVTIERTAFAGGFVEMVNLNGLRKFRRIVHVVVNAQTNPGQDWAKRERSPGFVESVIATPGVTLSRYGFETIETFLSERDRWMENLREYRCTDPASGFGQADCADAKSYFVELSFDRHLDAAEKDYLRALPTSFKLDDEQVDRVRRAARDLLAQSSSFQALLDDLVSMPARQPVIVLDPSLP
ncbi:MAG: patatin-like phospholipase family protein [Gammaproteobacteria bacterium]